MANHSSTQGHNQPNHEDQVKGGQHSHQGGSHDSSKTSTNVNQTEQRNQDRTANDAPVKSGGQSPRSGGNS